VELSCGAADMRYLAVSAVGLAVLSCVFCSTWHPILNNIGFNDFFSSFAAGLEEMGYIVLPSYENRERSSFR